MQQIESFPKLAKLSKQRIEKLDVSFAGSQCRPLSVFRVSCACHGLADVMYGNDRIPAGYYGMATDLSRTCVGPLYLGDTWV